MSSSQLRRSQSPSGQLLLDLNAALESIFVRAGKEFLQSKDQVGYTIARVKAMESIKQVITIYRNMRGKEAVSQALKELHLEEFDTE